MRLSLILLGVILMVPISAAEAPLEVDMDFKPVPHCSIRIDPDLCLLSWEPGPNSGVGDDRFNTAQAIRSVRVRLDTPEGGPPVAIEVEPEDVAIHHPVNPILNATWIGLNDTLPEVAKEWVTLESREINKGKDPEPRGLLIVFHFPTPLDIPTMGDDRTTYSQDAYSWDCSNYFTSYENWDKACSYDTLRPFPSGIDNHDRTDRMLSVPFSMLPCDREYTNITPEACPAFAEGEAVGEQAVSLWKSATPDVGFEQSIDQVKIKAKGSDLFLRPSSGNENGLMGRRPSLAGQTGAVPGRLLHPSALPPLEGEPSASIASPPTIVSPELHQVASIKASLSGKPTDASWSRLVGTIAATVGLLFAIGLGLYHRINSEAALENPNRQRILEAIRQQPGKSAGALARALGINYVTTRHHLRVLESCHLIEGHAKATSPGAQRRYFLNGGSYSREEKVHVMALSSTPAKAIFDYVTHNGETEFALLVKALDLPYSTASRSVHRLVQARLLRKERTGGRLIVAAANH